MYFFKDHFPLSFFRKTRAHCRSSSLRMTPMPTWYLTMSALNTFLGRRSWMGCRLLRPRARRWPSWGAAVRGKTYKLERVSRTRCCRARLLCVDNGGCAAWFTALLQYFCWLLVWLLFIIDVIIVINISIMGNMHEWTLSKLPVTPEFRSRATVRFSEQIITCSDNYPCIFPRPE